jgi:phage/plasmid-associated DNA primase
LTGGDVVSARFMRQDFFDYRPQFKLIIAGNHKPGLRSVDEAIRRRFHLVPFAVTIPPDERAWEQSSNLFASWAAWADKSGEAVGTMRRFSQTLESRGFLPQRRMDGRGFFGLRLLQTAATDNRWSDP